VGSDVRAIVLDVVRRDAGSTGRVAPGQAGFLRRELAHAGRRWVVVFSHQGLGSSLSPGECESKELEPVGLSDLVRSERLRHLGRDARIGRKTGSGAALR